MAPGTSLNLGVLRDGKPETIHVTVGEFHNDKSGEEASNAGSGDQHARLGVGVANLTPELRQQYNVPDNVHGAVIESVRPGSPADDAGLSAGFVILGVDRHPVGSADNFVESSALSAGRQRHPAAGVGQRRVELSRDSSRSEFGERHVKFDQRLRPGRVGRERPGGVVETLVLG